MFLVSSASQIALIRRALRARRRSLPLGIAVAAPTRTAPISPSRVELLAALRTDTAKERPRCAGQGRGDGWSPSPDNPRVPPQNGNLDDCARFVRDCASRRCTILIWPLPVWRGHQRELIKGDSEVWACRLPPALAPDSDDMVKSTNNSNSQERTENVNSDHNEQSDDTELSFTKYNLQKECENVALNNEVKHDNYSSRKTIQVISLNKKYNTTVIQIMSELKVDTVNNKITKWIFQMKEMKAMLTTTMRNKHFSYDGDDICCSNRYCNDNV
ncbi:hypothetical protein HUJ04_006834 [Dendroctonus ponderosae]|nr:hypothetical protein HUJ04_006834 [Dendroctonus ponderosae]